MEVEEGSGYGGLGGKLDLVGIGWHWRIANFQLRLRRGGVSTKAGFGFVLEFGEGGEFFGLRVAGENLLERPGQHHGGVVFTFG